MTIDDFVVLVATKEHKDFAEEICNEMHESAKARGTGIARRSPEYVAQKMIDNKAVIAFHKDGRWAGFSYIETWGHEDYVANSGLIISPPFRKLGLAKAIKTKTYALSIYRYKGAKLFGLTTGLAVMKINSELGYVPVPYSELTDDESFWQGCQSCVNAGILDMKQHKNCLCTAMIFDPNIQKPAVNIEEVLKDYISPLHQQSHKKDDKIQESHEPQLTDSMQQKQRNRNWSIKSLIPTKPFRSLRLMKSDSRKSK